MTKNLQPISKLIAETLEKRISKAVHLEDFPLKQAELAQEFGVSHIPVREALALLAEKGLVEIRPNRGAIVLALTGTRCLELAKMRVALEELALRQSFARVSSVTLRLAEKAVREGKAAKEIDVRAQKNWEFHALLYAPADMPFLMKQLRALWSHADRYLNFAWLQVNYENRSDEDHEHLVEIYKRGDLESAAITLRKHILDAAETTATELELRRLSK